MDQPFCVNASSWLFYSNFRTEKQEAILFALAHAQLSMFAL
jgi:hypothetical protein